MLLRRLLVAVAVLTSPCLAAELDAGRYLTADKLKRGMKGHGLTVFKGIKPEKFGVEIIGVMRNAWGVGRDMILVRCSGQDLENTGIAAGMSGSPVYVDGKLIGALAYAFSFAKAPIAGVTPIAEMLPLVEPPPKPKAGADSVTMKLDRPFSVFGRTFNSVAVSAHNQSL